MQQREKVGNTTEGKGGQCNRGKKWVMEQREKAGNATEGKGG